jgi:hypothetical protein
MMLRHTRSRNTNEQHLNQFGLYESQNQLCANPLLFALLLWNVVDLAINQNPEWWERTATTTSTNSELVKHATHVRTAWLQHMWTNPSADWIISNTYFMAMLCARPVKQAIENRPIVWGPLHYPTQVRTETLVVVGSMRKMIVHPPSYIIWGKFYVSCRAYTTYCRRVCAVKRTKNLFDCFLM